MRDASAVVCAGCRCKPRAAGARMQHRHFLLPRILRLHCTFHDTPRLSVLNVLCLEFRAWKSFAASYIPKCNCLCGHCCCLDFRLRLSAALPRSIDSTIKMSRPAVSRVLNQCLRQSKRPRLTCSNSLVASATQARRNASSKHPKDFVPPTQEDLLELRERVRLFTSKIFTLVRTKTFKLISTIRTRDPRRVCPKSRPHE